MRSASNAMSRVFTSAGISETLLELYSHSNSDGLSSGMPITQM